MMRNTGSRCDSDFDRRILTELEAHRLSVKSSVFEYKRDSHIPLVVLSIRAVRSKIPKGANDKNVVVPLVRSKLSNTENSSNKQGQVTH